jgi:hypothetical protein
MMLCLSPNQTKKNWRIVPILDILIIISQYVALLNRKHLEMIPNIYGHNYEVDNFID